VWSGHSCPLPLNLTLFSNLEGEPKGQINFKINLKTDLKTKSGGPECPRYTIQLKDG
jgi:hypothetical protein